METVTKIDTIDIIPIDVRLKTAIKSKHGLFPHEILVLNYAHTYYIKENSFQGFWWYQYGIRDVQSILSSLENRGFLKIGSLRAVLNEQTSVAIKDILRENKVKLTGKKADLIQRALDEIPENELIKRFPERIYELTNAGQTAIKDEEYVFYIHRNPIGNLDIWSLNKLVYNPPFYPFRDKIWGYLNEQSLKHFSNNDFGLYRYCCLDMAQFLIEELKIKEALAMLAKVIFFDLSCTKNNYNPQFLYVYVDSLLSYPDCTAKLAPSVLKTIDKCQKWLGYSDDDLKVALLEHMDKLYTPLQIFSAEECVQILFWERDRNVEELKKLYSLREREFKKNHPRSFAKKGQTKNIGCLTGILSTIVVVAILMFLL